MSKKKWMNEDFILINNCKKNNLSFKDIATQMNITTNALYKALQRLRNKKINTKNTLNTIDTTQLIKLANMYGITTKHKQIINIINEVNTHRRHNNLSKIVLYD